MLKRILSTFTGFAMIASTGTTLALSTGVANASPTERGNFSRYSAALRPLNNSNATGTAQLTFEGKELSVDLSASGLEPNQLHLAHIHGQLSGADAACPTNAADVNHDGFISVFEGAPAYGPIKLNLTSPQTPFGPSPTPALFAPFAGTPNTSNFSAVGDNGTLALSQTYTFDMSKSADRDAYRSLKDLDKQHIVIHGGTAPANVEDSSITSTAPVYDTLLPVACGEINLLSSKNNTVQMQVKMHTTEDSASRQ